MERATAPGLKWRPRKVGEPAAYWIASPVAVARGYTPKSVRLSGSDAEISARCARLQAEMAMWLGRAPILVGFDGTWNALFDLYELDHESPFKRCKPSTRRPYLVYLGKLRGHIGARRISECDGRDARRWFCTWSGGDESALRYGPKLGAAHMALAVVKAALSWGIECRKPGCADFRAILSEIEFPHLKSRTAAPTAAEVERARAAAHAAGAPSRALAYAFQFDTTLRQWDVIGAWVPLSDPRPSAVLGPHGKWTGLHWHHIGADLVLRYTPSKTDGTSDAEIIADLSLCPMVLAEIARTPVEARRGPLVVCEATGRPFVYETYRGGWKRDFKAAGIERKVWNRDLRAGGLTEGRRANASKDDLKKVGGHTERSRSAEVYDRAKLEAQRRVATARKAFREGGEGV